MKCMLFSHPKKAINIEMSGLKNSILARLDGYAYRLYADFKKIQMRLKPPISDDNWHMCRAYAETWEYLSLIDFKQEISKVEISDDKRCFALGIIDILLQLINEASECIAVKDEKQLFQNLVDTMSSVRNKTVEFFERELKVNQTMKL